ncbi:MULTISPECIES: GNAT family N-acetyltransferase [Paenibacillus]|uniref:GNAT family N-acetyltransferase n=1 Tax=Paenibacillus cucumis (ex Kampfer et al. 2016) TaxID=1776858 RepID=A0ABS7KPH4_9BACL|nr:GNAT family N-acetyltransferase [Paenibacillus cucumis (ex Kampfer et al. 2016)]MBY0205911.1 GNAT family N-acetyltransferase [Paenibacillus cucumis (ex Kampfer et al. 2016)]MDP9699120.1 GNAT superfamily N-acetyltransferase [Paenibacillus intestini]
MQEVKLMQTTEEIQSTFDVIKLLRPHLIESEYYKQIKRMQQGGYQLAAVLYHSEVKSVAGFRINESLAWKKFMYVDDLITVTDGRSHGFGKTLLHWLENFAKENDCSQIHLDSGVQRHEAHRFYLRERMDITCYHFSKLFNES